MENYQKMTVIMFLCFIAFDLIYIQIRSPSGIEIEKDIFFKRGENVETDRINCVGYGKNRTKEKQVCKKRLPNCLIIGVAKAGTYALLKFLSAHPQVVRNENINEYDFFSLQYEKGISWYKSKMPKSLAGQVVLDKSPSYFTSPDAPVRIFRMNPSIRLILTVRHPIHRSVSAYAMHKDKFVKPHTSKQQEKVSNYETQTLGPFETQWSHFIQFYDVYFGNWLKYFNRAQIHIVDGDALVKNPIIEMKKIEKFLDIDHYFDSSVFVFNSTKGFYCLQTRQKEENRTDNMDCLYETKGRTHPIVSEKVLQEMQALYRPHNKQFYKLSGRHFDWDTNI